MYGPAEMFGNVGGNLKIVMLAQKAGPVASAQGPQVVAEFGFAGPNFFLFWANFFFKKRLCFCIFPLIPINDGDTVETPCHLKMILAKYLFLNSQRLTKKRFCFFIFSLNVIKDS